MNIWQSIKLMKCHLCPSLKERIENVEKLGYKGVSCNCGGVCPKEYQKVLYRLIVSIRGNVRVL